MTYANIIVDISHEKLDKPFQYRIPEELEGKLLPGMVVEIPFGRGDRLIKGYVIGTTDRAEIAPERIKSIHAVSTDGVGVESRLIALAAWMRDLRRHDDPGSENRNSGTKKGKTKREKAGTAGGI